MENLVYQEMSEEENALDWRVTRQVMADRVLMKTLEDCQASGEKHAVIARVQEGALTEAYVSPEAAVRAQFPFNPVEQAFAHYDVRDGVCLVIVRDGKVVISINGVR